MLFSIVGNQTYRVWLDKTMSGIQHLTVLSRRSVRLAHDRTLCAHSVWWCFSSAWVQLNTETYHLLGDERHISRSEQRRYPKRAQVTMA